VANKLISKEIKFSGLIMNTSRMILVTSFLVVLIVHFILIYRFLFESSPQLAGHRLFGNKTRSYLNFSLYCVISLSGKIICNTNQ
jgi:hypothetical protein